jgi:1-acyl-sn-glycerol-3-phosphate acyltransferase
MLMRLIGWRVEGDLPAAPKFVVIVYPHTSNWDLPIGLICGYALGLLAGWPYGFMVKDSALHWPVLGLFIRAIGGIGINRRASSNAVDEMTAVFAQRERLMLAITPEGTRRKTGHWRTGFYYIALKARVPIVLAYLDYARQVTGLGPLLTPCGDIEADFELMRRFYANVTPKFPHEAGAIQIRPQPAANER